MKNPQEQDLNTDDLDMFGRAVRRCQNISGHCVQDGYCHNGGACFDIYSMTPEQSLKHIEKLEKELDELKCKYRKIEIKHNSVICEVEQKVKQARQEKSERIFPLQFVLHYLRGALK